MEEALNLPNHWASRPIAKDFRLYSGKDALLQACLTVVDAGADDTLDPAMVIVRSMWVRLHATHVLCLVK